MTTQPREEFFAQIEGVLERLYYKIDKNDGKQFLVAYSQHHWDTEHNYSFSANHKRKLALNYDTDGRIFFGIREDGDTRYVFNGEIDHVNDILWIDAKTRILPHKLTPLEPITIETTSPIAKYAKYLADTEEGCTIEQALNHDIASTIKDFTNFCNTNQIPINDTLIKQMLHENNCP